VRQILLHFELQLPRVVVVSHSVTLSAAVSSVDGDGPHSTGLLPAYQHHYYNHIHKPMLTMRATIAALFLALALPIHGSLAPWGKSPANLFGLAPTSSSVKLQQHEHTNNPLLKTRGGATKAAPGDEAGSDVEEEEVKELYLPGLLDTVVDKSSLV
jgi:hypothetical protein